MKKLLLVLTCLAPSLNEGLLPPLYETLHEFQALVNDPQLPKSLSSGEAIMAIERKESQFIVSTNKRTLTVNIVKEPSELIGPGKFHLEYILDPIQTGSF